MVREEVRVAIVLGTVLTACYGFELVGVEPNLPPSLSIYLDVVQKQLASFDLTARFVRGTDSHGRLNTPSNRAIVVEGNAIAPLPPTNRLDWSYRSIDTLPNRSGDRSLLNLTIPAMLPVLSSSAPLSLPLAERDGGEVVTWIKGTDLRLRLLPQRTATELQFTASSWQLELRDRCTNGGEPVLRVVSGSAYPQELRVPWVASLETSVDSIRACFQSISGLRTSAPYEVQVALVVRLEWHVRILLASTGSRRRPL